VRALPRDTLTGRLHCIGGGAIDKGRSTGSHGAMVQAGRGR